MDQDIDEVTEVDPYQGLRDAVKAKAGATGKYFDMLNPSEKKDVIEFVAWLKTTAMSAASTNSYKSYVTKALLKSDGRLAGDPTNDEKSGVRKFLVWLDSKDPSSEEE